MAFHALLAGLFNQLINKVICRFPVAESWFQSAIAYLWELIHDDTVQFDLYGDVHEFAEAHRFDNGGIGPAFAAS